MREASNIKKDKHKENNIKIASNRKLFRIGLKEKVLKVAKERRYCTQQSKGDTSKAFFSEIMQTKQEYFLCAKSKRMQHKIIYPVNNGDKNGIWGTNISLQNSSP